MAKIEIDCVDPNKISDGYHTFEELYAHRIILFICLMCCNKSISWRAKKHSDGGCLVDWFVAGMDLDCGQISYHIPDRFWDQLNDIKTLERAPNWDGHTSDDVLKRLNSWAKQI